MAAVFSPRPEVTNERKRYTEALSGLAGGSKSMIVEIFAGDLA